MLKISGFEVPFYVFKSLSAYFWHGIHSLAERNVNVVERNIVRADPDDDGKLFYRRAFAVALKEARVLPDISAGEPVVADTECAEFAAV